LDIGIVKKLIKLSLAIGKAPVISFKPLTEIIHVESEEFSSSETPLLNQDAEPIKFYKCEGK